MKPDDTSHHHFSNSGRQFGQSSVFVIVFLGITILSLVFLYKAGMLTSEKMELQNAADGVAYSVAILEARDLNFMAYTNRAMVANEVAIGQAVGLASWPRHWESIGYYENGVCGTALEPGGFALEKGGQAIKDGLGSIPYVGVIFKAIGTVLKKTGEEIKAGCVDIRAGTKADLIDRGKNLTKAVDKDIAIPLAQLMEKANQGLSDAQAIFHLGTIAYVAKTVSQVARGNKTDNNPGDTGLSPYGLAAILGHLMSFGHLAPFGTTPGQRYGPDTRIQDKPFIRTHRPGSGDSADKTGFERFAAITGAARDEFAKGPRRWVARPDFRKDPLDIPILKDFPLGICPLPGICLGWFNIVLEVKKGITTTIDHRAGSELHYVNNGQGDQYSWSSADTSTGSVDFTISVVIKIQYAPPSLGPKNYTTLAGGNIDLSIGTGGISFNFGVTLPFIGPFSFPVQFGAGLIPDFPYGAAAAQVNNNFNNQINLDVVPNILPLPIAGLPGVDYYGHAPGGSSVWLLDKPARAIAWSIGVPPFLNPSAGVPPFKCPKANSMVPSVCFVPTVSAWMPFKNVGGSVGGRFPGVGYTGLKQYSDTTDASDLWGFEGPHIIIALQKSIPNIFSTTQEPTGQFKLTESGNTNDVIGAIAKGEVYFKRPSDMDLFRRWDTAKSSSGNSDTLYEEYGSAFNPYWQARLAPLSHADRAVATVQQHGQDLELGTTANQTIIASWNLDAWIPPQ